MCVAAVVEQLSTTPMRSYGDLAPRSPTAPATVAGFYAWWQVPGTLPGVPGTAHGTADLELLYVGIAPRDARSKSNLRKRLGNHHRAAIGSSTFRLDLVAFLWESLGWSPFWTDRPKLPDDELAELARWQSEHLCVQWIEVPDPWLIEAEVVRTMSPPLNREHNAHHAFYSQVGYARERLRRAAKVART